MHSPVIDGEGYLYYESSKTSIYQFMKEGRGFNLHIKQAIKFLVNKIS
jgi:hypothetical protein